MDAKTPVRDPDSANHRAADIKAPKTGLTLQEYAALKGLPINFLKGEGLVDSDYFWKSSRSDSISQRVGQRGRCAISRIIRLGKPVLVEAPN